MGNCGSQARPLRHTHGCAINAANFEGSPWGGHCSKQKRTHNGMDAHPDLGPGCSIAAVRVVSCAVSVGLATRNA